MVDLQQMTLEQLASYRRIWGQFLGMEFTFMSPRGVLAFYGDLDVSQRGMVSLATLFVGNSLVHPKGALTAEFEKLRASIAANGWSLVAADGRGVEAEKEGFRVEFFSAPMPDGRVGTHLLLTHGDASSWRQTYMDRDFAEYAAPSDKSGRGTYQAAGGYAPEKAEALDVAELARRLKGLALVAFTGAGISVGCGIPSFSGPGGLEAQFPISDYGFPGKVPDRLIARPAQTARILGRFYAGFMTAQPGAAHRALVELERLGILKHIITGNFDGLHERAGSRNVHVNEQQYFARDGEGWSWISQGRAALVAGVSSEAEYGLLDYARAKHIQLAAIAPDRPYFLTAGDWFTPGRAEDVLPQLAALLSRGAVTDGQEQGGSHIT